ncbi:MAG: hypothetical protein R3F40_10365 [Candidatus Competibacteraceae bacterium]
MLDKDKATYHSQALDVLLQLLRDRIQPEQKRADGRQYPRYREELALDALPPLLDHDNAAIRTRVVEVLGIWRRNRRKRCWSGCWTTATRRFGRWLARNWRNASSPACRARVWSR